MYFKSRRLLLLIKSLKKMRFTTRIRESPTFVLNPGKNGVKVSQDEPRESKVREFRKFMPKKTLIKTPRRVINY